jgi:hypothetical protein
MAYRLTRWPILIRDNPAKAKREILDAVTIAEGTVRYAAKALETPENTLWRYIKVLGIQPEIEVIRASSKPTTTGVPAGPALQPDEEEAR